MMKDHLPENREDVKRQDERNFEWGTGLPICVREGLQPKFRLSNPQFDEDSFNKTSVTFTIWFFGIKKYLVADESLDYGIFKYSQSYSQLYLVFKINQTMITLYHK